LPPIRDGGSSQIPGNSSLLSNDLQNGDGNLAWEVDVSDWFPHGRMGKKPGSFYFACFFYFTEFFWWLDELYFGWVQTTK
jgi:hypothetical protein